MTGEGAGQDLMGKDHMIVECDEYIRKLYDGKRADLKEESSAAGQNILQEEVSKAFKTCEKRESCSTRWNYGRRIWSNGIIWNININ